MKTLRMKTKWMITVTAAAALAGCGNGDRVNVKLNFPQNPAKYALDSVLGLRADGFPGDASCAPPSSDYFCPLDGEWDMNWGEFEFNQSSGGRLFVSVHYPREERAPELFKIPGAKFGRVHFKTSGCTNSAFDFPENVVIPVTPGPNRRIGLEGQVLGETGGANYPYISAGGPRTFADGCYKLARSKKAADSSAEPSYDMAYARMIPVLGLSQPTDIVGDTEISDLSVHAYSEGFVISGGKRLTPFPEALPTMRPWAAAAGASTPAFVSLYVKAKFPQGLKAGAGPSWVECDGSTTTQYWNPMISDGANPSPYIGYPMNLQDTHGTSRLFKVPQVTGTGCVSWPSGTWNSTDQTANGNLSVGGYGMPQGGALVDFVGPLFPNRIYRFEFANGTNSAIQLSDEATQCVVCNIGLMGELLGACERQAIATCTNDNTAVSTPPGVFIMSPTGGQNVPINSAFTVTWTATDTIGFLGGPVSIDYTKDNGATWTPIVTGYPNTGSYQWSTPITPSATSKIRITVTNIMGLSGTMMTNTFNLQ